MAANAASQLQIEQGAEHLIDRDIHRGGDLFGEEEGSGGEGGEHGAGEPLGQILRQTLR